MAKKVIVIVYICFTLLFSTGLLGFQVSAQKTSTSTGIVVPLYTYPTDSSWASLIRIKVNYPSVPIIAIINPDNGAGSSKDPTYVYGIKQLQAAGITVLGYVYTNYGSRNVKPIESEMSDYKNWYGVNGIFFDEMSNAGNTLTYYTRLATFAKSINLGLTMGNPGTTVSSNLVGVFSNLCIYENPGMPSMSQIDSYGSFGRGFSYIAYGVGSMPSQSTVRGTANYVAYLYITNLGGSNPYNGLPAYIASEAAALAS
jgi:hypothetical protein